MRDPSKPGETVILPLRLLHSDSVVLCMECENSAAWMSACIVSRRNNIPVVVELSLLCDDHWRGSRLGVPIHVAQPIEGKVKLSSEEKPEP